jgi:spore protease
LNSFEKFRSGIRTDLACERHRACLDTPGTTYAEEKYGSLLISRLSVKSAEGALQIEKPQGNYLTLTFPPLFELAQEEYPQVTRKFSDILASLLPKDDRRPILLAGLGNAAMTADAVGPQTADLVFASAHLTPAGICVLKPGVTAQSGMEAARIISATAHEIKARAVIAVDALCARSTRRLMCTVQIADTGITPGSGIREPREALDASSVGVPVIAVGVPTMVSTAAVICDAWETTGAEQLPDAPPSLLLEDSLYVCPRDVDLGVARAAALIAEAVNLL